MEREIYYEKGKKRNLPPRCPLIGRCERYAQTIFYLSELNLYGEGNTIEEKLRSWGYLSDDYELTKANLIGEPFKFRKTNLTCDIGNCCPEVPLFNNDMVFGFIPEKPIVNGFWDDVLEMKKFKVERLGHFSECPEFSHHIFSNKKTKKTVLPKMFVYLMINHSNGYYKIGRSANPRFRERTLQAQEPKVELIEFWEAAKKVEIDLHKIFKDKRLRGEWFELNMEDLNQVYSIMENKD